MTSELAPGICGGEKSLEAYLRYMGVQSLEELEKEQQLCLFPKRLPEERCDRSASIVSRC